MAAFEYSALNAQGRLEKGVLSADTPRQVRQVLRDKGLAPVSVEPVAGGTAKAVGGRMLSRGMGATGLALFTRQLATLVKSGSVLGEALDVVNEQSESAKVKKVVTAVRAKVMEGMSLARAMADFPQVFPDLYRATVEAGEQSGRLDQVLERLAEYTEFKQQLGQKIVLAMAYPVLLTSVAVLVVIGMLAYVVPQIITVFRNIDQELPVLTRLVISASEFFSHYGSVLLVILILLLFAARSLMRYGGIRKKVHGAMLSVPVVGRFLKALDVSRFTRTLSMLVASGVPVLDGMKVGAGVMNNWVLRDAVTEAAKGVREGKSVSRALAASKCFPPMVIHLIASGEASAELDTMLSQAAVSQEKEVEMVAGLATAVFEPLLILVMGGVVLLIVLAILLPIFELNQLVR
ncbi:MAG: type II secretion system inner membrane protein GspF [Proteobacteria bacterium]|nr:type II secretion system inner membrane protein GspF [Pseudomonadota bacterium]MBU1737031.1 type II secretion system inner membrane protein GspF [Pseudomonadota bacterium]